MPLPWPAISSVSGELPEDKQQNVKAVLDRWADRVQDWMNRAGFPPAASPLFRPWNLVVMVDAERVMAAFTPLQGSMASIYWLDRSSNIVPPQSLVQSIRMELGLEVNSLLSLPRTIIEGQENEGAIEAAAVQHIAEMERALRLGRLGDLTGLEHLEPYLRLFLDDHPDPEKNVFIMMRFIDTLQMREVHAAIRGALEERGYHPVRADDRDYTGELWTNIEVCMAGCHLGVAVFEDIEERDFNPNVSLELGFMLGRRRRCLILKEQRLPELPTDVVHRLYKHFDMFNVQTTIRAQVLRWIDVDLGGPARPS